MLASKTTAVSGGYVDLQSGMNRLVQFGGLLTAVG